MRRVDALVVAAVGAVVVVGAVDALRADERETTTTSVTATPVPDAAAIRRARAEYVQRAAAVCAAGTARLEAVRAESFAERSAAAERIMRDAVTDLEALPRPPESERDAAALVRILRREHEAFARVAAAAAAGSFADAQRVDPERARLARERANFIDELEGRWDLPSLRLQACPHLWTSIGNGP